MIAASSTVVKNKICREIEEILLRRFSSSHVEVINQSYDVNGIKPEDDPELASFLRVIVVSSKFENKTLIYSHMQVTQALNEEGVYEKVHSIQILTKTPEQWKKDKEKKKKEEEEKRKEEEKKRKEEEGRKGRGGEFTKS